MFTSQFADSVNASIKSKKFTINFNNKLFIENLLEIEYQKNMKDSFSFRIKTNVNSKEDLSNISQMLYIDCPIFISDFEFPLRGYIYNIKSDLIYNFNCEIYLVEIEFQCSIYKPNILNEKGEINKPVNKNNNIRKNKNPIRRKISFS